MKKQSSDSLKILLLASQQFPSQNQSYSKIISKYLLSSERPQPKCIDDIVYTFDDQQNKIQIWNCNAYYLKKDVIKLGCVGKDIVIIVGQVSHCKSKRKKLKQFQNKIQTNRQTNINNKNTEFSKVVDKKKQQQDFIFQQKQSLSSIKSHQQQKTNKILTNQQLSNLIRKVNKSCVIAYLYIGLPKDKLQNNINMDINQLNKSIKNEQIFVQNIQNNTNKSSCVETVYPIIDKYLQFVVPFSVLDKVDDDINIKTNNENLLRIIQQLSIYYNKSMFNLDSNSTNDTWKNRSMQIKKKDSISNFIKKGSRKSYDVQTIKQKNQLDLQSHTKLDQYSLRMNRAQQTSFNSNLMKNKSVYQPRQNTEQHKIIYLNRTENNIVNKVQKPKKKQQKEDDCFLISLFCVSKFNKQKKMQQKHKQSNIYNGKTSCASFIPNNHKHYNNNYSRIQMNKTNK